MHGLFSLEGNVSVIVRPIIGAIVGGLLGYGMYRFIGCSSGACPITSNPWMSTIFGMILGALLAKAI
ncbi:MAG: YtxH domain-containing protein [Phycisphaerae bacterium]|nr:YtxH domain-containing protein [Phycisphaerae bacterium]